MNVKRFANLSSLATRNRGVALFISLVLLLVLTIIGISAVQTTSLETRMARNEYDTLLAFQAAESALRDAEAFLETVVTTALFTDTAVDPGLWTVADVGDPNRWDEANVWTGANSIEAPVGGVVAEEPRYIIEHVASVVREENAYQLSDPYS
jgi:type IV pilus assembly protein PilX